MLFLKGKKSPAVTTRLFLLVLNYNDSSEPLSRNKGILEQWRTFQEWLASRNDHKIALKFHLAEVKSLVAIQAGSAAVMLYKDPTV